MGHGGDRWENGIGVLDEPCTSCHNIRPRGTSDDLHNVLTFQRGTHVAKVDWRRGFGGLVVGIGERVDGEKFVVAEGVDGLVV